MIQRELLDILVCPESRLPLEMAKPELLTRLNLAIGRGRIVNRSGQKVAESLDEALVRTDQRLLYPVVDGIPNMLPDDAIVLDQLASVSP